MKVLIVSAWRDRYEGDRRARAFPSLSAVHLAALCPPGVEARVWHEQVRPLDLASVDADLVAVTSTTGSARHMYEIADRLRERGIPVILGGPHASLVPEEALRHAEAVAVGDAEVSFPAMLRDFERGRLAGVYKQPEELPLAGLPIPRYDLFEDSFLFRCFVQATRGCPFRCTFCTMKSLDPHFRVRPTNEVVRDIQACEGRNWLQRKMVFFYDDNLTGSPDYARELFRKLRPLRKWWWTQCSIDAAQDPGLLRLAADSGCLAVFVGVETFSAENLLAVRKGQNRINHYREAIKVFHNAGIAVHAGLIVGLDNDSPSSLRLIPEAVQDLSIDFPFVNVLTPFPGTPLRAQLEGEGRLRGIDWVEHNGAGITFLPRGMTPAELERTYWDIHHEMYSIHRTLRRTSGAARNVSFPGFIMNAYVNALYAFQNIVHPDGPFPSGEHSPAGQDTATPAVTSGHTRTPSVQG